MKPAAIVSGDADNGYVVDLHDGERHAVYAVQADGMDAALADAMTQWDEPQSDRGADERPIAAQTFNAPPTMPADHPEQADPLAVDVTRGRSDILGSRPLPSYDAEHVEHPLLPLEPGDAMTVSNDNATLGEKLELAERRAESEGDTAKTVGGTAEPHVEPETNKATETDETTHAAESASE